MSKKVNLMLVISLLLAIFTSACEKIATQVPFTTPTLFGGASAGGTVDDPMQMLRMLATQTAMAAAQQDTTPTLLTSETSEVSTLTSAELTKSPTPTATSLLHSTGTPSTSTSLVTPFTVSSTTPGRPTTYALLPGEYPYCIARRFNLNPQQLIAANGLIDGDTYQPGLVLTIPSSISNFPGDRELHAHPDSYTITSSDETIYKVACYYGDLDWTVIAAANEISAPYTLHIGQVVQIP